MGVRARVDEVRDHHFDDEQDRPDQQQLEDADALDESASEAGADHRTERGAKTHDRKQPLAFILAVQIVGERPELRHDHHVENADPEEKGNPQRDAGMAEHVEDHQADDEESGHRIDQPAAIHPFHQTAVDRDDEGQQDHFDGGEIGLQLRCPLAKNQRLSDRLQHVVRHQDEEDVQRQQERGKAFAIADVREQPEKPIERTSRWLHRRILPHLSGG